MLTLGHSHRSWAEFHSMLEAAGVRVLVDVRAFPRSRRHPQFDRVAIEKALGATPIRYMWEGRDLGGFREPGPGNPHRALREDTARAYAEHLTSERYVSAEQRLKQYASTGVCAVMCAEGKPHQCHRRFIADSLSMQGWTVRHWVSEDEHHLHELSSEARCVDGALIYDRNTQDGFDF